MAQKKLRHVLFAKEMNHWDQKARFFKHAMAVFATGSMCCLVVAAPLTLIPNPIAHSICAGLITGACCFAAMAFACLMVGVLFKTVSYAHQVRHDKCRLHPSDFFDHMTTEFRF